MTETELSVEEEGKEITLTDAQWVALKDLVAEHGLGWGGFALAPNIETPAWKHLSLTVDGQTRVFNLAPNGTATMKEE